MIYDKYRIKHFLSYLVDISLEKTSSSMNPELEIVLSKGRIRLETKNAVYSYGDLYHAFFQAFQELGMNEKSLKNVLVLGGGLGSIPIMLEEHFGQIANYDLVEFDPIIIQLAKKYIKENVLFKINFINEDALTFKPTIHQNYDLIAIDLFLDDQIPKLDAAFFKHLSSALSVGGLMLFNVLPTAQNLPLKAPFQKAFSTAKTIQTITNEVLIFQK